MELQLRFLSPQDIDQVKILCRDWFPIEYPDTWYQEITSNPRFFSLAATLNGTIIGLIVAETKELGQLAKEDRSLLASCFRSGTKVGYILSLGASEQFSQVKALYLHVLTTNTQAISFYEHRGFQVHSFLPYYYAIKGKRKDGFTHVLYLNGGHPTWGALDYVKLAALALCSLSPHRAVARLCSKLNLAWLATMPRLRRIAHSSQAIFS